MAPLLFMTTLLDLFTLCFMGHKDWGFNKDGWFKGRNALEAYELYALSKAGPSPLQA